MTLDILQLALSLILFCGGAVLSRYLYKKGENIAAKQDVSELTRIVEEVKKSYQEQDAKLKALLNLEVVKKSSVFNEEKEAIIAFHGQLNLWIWGGLKIHLYDYSNTGTLPALIERISKMRQLQDETYVKFSKVELLVNDKNLVLVGHKSVDAVLNLHRFIENNAVTLREALTTASSFINTISQGDVSGDIRQLNQTMLTNNSRYVLDAIKRDDNVHRLALFDTAYKLIAEFNAMARTYLNQ